MRRDVDLALRETIAFALAIIVSARASPLTIVFGPYDVETVFFVTKSSDRTVTSLRHGSCT